MPQVSACSAILIQAEQLAQGVDVALGAVLAQARHRVVQQALDQRLCSSPRCAGGPPRSGAARRASVRSSSACAHRLRPLAQRRDRRRHASARQPRLEAPRLLLDDRLHGADLAQARLQVRLGRRLQVVDVEEVDVGTSRAAASTSRGTAMSTMSSGRSGRDVIARATSCGADDRLRRGRGGDHDVGLRQRRRQLRSGIAHAVQLARDLLRQAATARRHQQPPDAVLHQRAGRALRPPRPRRRPAPSCAAGRPPGAGSGTRPAPRPTAPCAPISVSLRARRPTRMALWNRRASTGLPLPAAVAAENASRTWPRISDSPTTSDSMPAATRNRCRTASVPSRW